VPVTDHALSDLIHHKRTNPNSKAIEEALIDFSRQSLVCKYYGTLILGMFNRGNFTRLDCRINYHPTPPEKNCIHGIFADILLKLSQEQREMIQWGLYVPQRATTTYRMPLGDMTYRGTTMP
jgi:hypothetical protein